MTDLSILKPENISENIFKDVCSEIYSGEKDELRYDLPDNYQIVIEVIAHSDNDDMEITVGLYDSNKNVIKLLTDDYNCSEEDLKKMIESCLIQNFSLSELWTLKDAVSFKQNYLLNSVAHYDIESKEYRNIIKEIGQLEKLNNKLIGCLPSLNLQKEKDEIDEDIER